MLYYYNHPNKDSYQAALKQFKKSFPEYNNDNYPINKLLQAKSRIKHLK